ncbi:MAG: hypothetical protein KY462_07780 [Actinobacteria bacterium]|nr:hypothetical protein [Actinomycetota bacterium]
MASADVKRTVEAVWRIESAWMIAGVARLGHDVGPATLEELREAETSALRIQLSLDSDGEIAELRLGDRLPQDVADDLRFDPWHTGQALRPVGVLNRLRRPAYRASQSGRDAPSAGARDRLGVVTGSDASPAANASN